MSQFIDRIRQETSLYVARAAAVMAIGAGVLSGYVAFGDFEGSRRDIEVVHQIDQGDMQPVIGAIERVYGRDSVTEQLTPDTIAKVRGSYLTAAERQNDSAVEATIASASVIAAGVVAGLAWGVRWRKRDGESEQSDNLVLDALDDFDGTVEGVRISIEKAKDYLDEAGVVFAPDINPFAEHVDVYGNHVDEEEADADAVDHPYFGIAEDAADFLAQQPKK